MSSADYSLHGSVAAITLNNPPVNGLGHELRTGIMAGLDRATKDNAVKAVLIIGSAKAFSGGADIREFNTPKSTATPTLQTNRVNCERDIPTSQPCEGLKPSQGRSLPLDYETRTRRTR